MSNEYKDWIFDEIQDRVLEKGLIDTITDIYPQPDEGTPCYVEGLKDGEKVKYYVRLTEEGWLCEHKEMI